MKEQLLEYRLKGYCCAQIVADYCLKKMGKENQDMVDAMAGLCFGSWQDKLCGTLSAAICMLYLSDPKEASERNVRDLTDWFESTFDSVECADILEGNPLNKIEKCPAIVEATLMELSDMLSLNDISESSL